MATRSRTYLPTDWQVWVYTPVPGKFRLDFSTLGGADVLGGPSDLGSVQVLDLNINTIQIDEGQQPTSGVFFNFVPGTMSISAQLLQWDDALIKELYNGKQIYLTLKNESTYSHPIFGTNTIYFIGTIDSLDIQIDPINRVTNLIVSAVDGFGSAMNTPITVDRYQQKLFEFTDGLNEAKASGRVSQYLSATDFTGGLIDSTWENTGVTFETFSFGDLLQDIVTSGVNSIGSYYLQTTTGLLEHKLVGVTIQPEPTSGTAIPESIISNVQIGSDGGNVPTTFNLSNSVATYTYGVETANNLTNQSIYNQSLDIPTANLKLIADKIRQYVAKTQPLQVTILTAQTYQPILFDDRIPLSHYIYPKNHYLNSVPVTTTLSFTGKTAYHFIAGTSHTITPDDWQTTYQLWKGL
jgi:hypothetical protein